MTFLSHAPVTRGLFFRLAHATAAQHNPDTDRTDGGKFPGTHLDIGADATKPPGAQATQILSRGSWRSKSLNNYPITAAL